MQNPKFGSPVGNDALAVAYVNHVSFLFCGASGPRILIDPFLTGAFEWQGHTEVQQDAPGYTPADLGGCDAVFITHAHGDHFEVATVAALCEDGARLYGGEDVARQAMDHGIADEQIEIIDAGQRLELAGATVFVLPNLGSERERPCPRFSFGIQIGSALTFHSGDSHGPSESWSVLPKPPDVACLWPSHIGESIDYLQPERVLLMHTQRFEPGDFLCNVDAQALQRELADQFPEIQIRHLGCGEWLLI